MIIHHTVNHYLTRFIVVLKTSLAYLHYLPRLCQSLYLNPNGVGVCTGRHISHPDNLVWHFAGERILEFKLEFLMSVVCFVSWRYIIGEVGLLYSGPLLYAGLCSGARYGFLGVLQ